MCCVGDNAVPCVCLFLLPARLRVLSVCLCHLRVSVAAVQHVGSESRTHVPLPRFLHVATWSFAELDSCHCAGAKNQHERGDEWSL